MGKKYWTPEGQQQHPTGQQQPPPQKMSIVGPILGCLTLVVVFIMVGVGMIIAAAEKPRERPAAAPPAGVAAESISCEAAEGEAVAAIREGMRRGGKFTNPAQVEVPIGDRVRRPFGEETTFPATIIAGKMDDGGLAVFGRSEDGGFLLPLNDAAIEWSKIGSAIAEGSDADVMRDEAAELPHADNAQGCVAAG